MNPAHWPARRIGWISVRSGGGGLGPPAPRGPRSRTRGRPLRATAASAPPGVVERDLGRAAARRRPGHRPSPGRSRRRRRRRADRGSRTARPCGFAASAASARLPASAGDRPSLARPRSRSVRSRRSLSTRPVVSLTMQKTPPTLPHSSRTGSYETSKYVSSGKPWRSRKNGWSAAQNASPVAMTPSSNGPSTSQISPHTSRAGLAEAPGMLAGRAPGGRRRCRA